MGIVFSRKCIVCNIRDNKNNFIRITKKINGEIVIDEFGKAEGRGAYICNNIECINKAEKENKLSKVFKTNVDKDIYNNIRGVVIDKSQNETNKS